MNIALIGMPGAGKSTISALLAQKLKYQFIDSDLLIEERAGCKLSELIAEKGINAFKVLEEEVMVTLNPKVSTIISTGGSVIYSSAGIEHISQISKIIFLNAPLALVEKRLGNYNKRGIIGLEVGGLGALYSDRYALYQRYAELTITINDSDTPELIAQKIIRAL